ncbi:ankyrin repeat protein, putative [Trichomonas vaginalis G3]|uniref:Ankyrin repeat protein, putative n=1 Tax=Trichomonas vaginalis (strain ATCC PRA-98 / G3) TaxID=412133 RepID=A2ENW5_TRIV3|nr:ankyrin repeat and SOCS box-containing protein 4 family [Trichomonas vaginalis G3]EAY05655.1 ankyrin repeat protein, putative [Trichomonas vaginalis G3]KAI5553895.1 ankyrin repeat and SOCS box-containing protein 4 family [Trichomonas vaginalis G3]|eukprot:XP_001317878.1 ankyrin repeat protein [Trichomonas vaginalis G3]
MSNEYNNPNKYIVLRSINKNHIDSCIALYQLRTENEEELNSIYKMIKTNLIDSKEFLPENIMKDILDIIPYNNRYIKSYLALAKLIFDDYHVKEVSDIGSFSSFLFYKEYGIKLKMSDNFEQLQSEYIEIHAENTIYEAIMYNNLERFISFTERKGFNKDQKLKNQLYPYSEEGYSLLELCCYHGAVGCFKLLRTKFHSKITKKCLRLSFLGRNPEIMNECLKYQKPDEKCMKYAIISHNIDFVTFLVNEYNLEIDLYYCKIYNNLESLLVYFDLTNDISRSFSYSLKFNIPSLCNYFISIGLDINEKYSDGETVLHEVAKNNSKEMIELLLSHGANINEKDNRRENILQVAVKNNRKETIEFLLSHGASINGKGPYGITALQIAVTNNRKEIVELLLSHGANINENDGFRQTALHIATINNNKEIVELLLSHGANPNKFNDYGQTALHIAVKSNSKEIIELLLSHGADINQKDNGGRNCLYYAVYYENSIELVELLLSHGININEKDSYGYTALYIAVIENKKEIRELLLSHGAKYK